MSEWIRHNSSTSKFPSIHSIIWPTASPASEGLSDWTRFLNKPEIKNHSRFEFLTKMISTGDFSVSLEIPGLVLVQKFLRHYSDGWTYIKFKHFLSLWQSDVSGSNVKMNRNIYLKFLSNQIIYDLEGPQNNLITPNVCFRAKVFVIQILYLDLKLTHKLFHGGSGIYSPTSWRS